MPWKEDAAPPSRALEDIDGYLPIEDHGLIGDGETAALVGRDGRVSWLCVPRFDSPALFCGVLDAGRGGAFTIAPEELRESRQRYVPESGVLVTEMRGPEGVVRVTDALTLRSGVDLTEGLPGSRGELLRSVEVLEGTVRLRIDVSPRGGAEARRRGSGLQLRCAGRDDLDLQLEAQPSLDGLKTVQELRRGERRDFLLRWRHGAQRYHPMAAGEVLAGTIDAWRRWTKSIDYDGPEQPLVRRSAITLKLLDYFENGAIIAAPTTSLPEEIGGCRNWDYRYAWIRDAAFSVYALRRIGLAREAWAFLGWVLDDVERGEKPNVLYNLDGRQPPEEWEDSDLDGYRGSRPVRWGNAAAEQRQNDVFGEMLDCAYQWAARGGEIPEHLWKHLREFVDQAREAWQVPDHGIWEVRSPGRLFTYSVALCQVALDRGARLGERLGLPCDVSAWKSEAAQLREAVLERAWDEEQHSLTEALDAPGAGLDASLLCLPLRRVVPADHPRMVATCAAVADKLSAGNGLLYRYLPDKSPDGLAGHEGAFLLCSFWLADNWALTGRLDDAQELYDSLCARANPLGLLPEQIDPSSGRFLGNFPQAFSHVGVISTGVTLARRLNSP